MKSIVALVVFTIIIVFSADSAVAESNPLLTIFEGVEVGMNVGEVIDAVLGFDMGGGCYCMVIKTDNPKVLEAISYSRDFKSPGKDVLIGVKAPIGPHASLQIEMDRSLDSFVKDLKNAKVVKITYSYEFMKFKKELVKK